MEKVINVLYEIEEKANRILDRTTEQKKQLHEQLNADLAKLDETIKAETNQQLTIMKASMEAEIEAERTAMNEDCKSQLASLETTFLEKRSILVNQVFKKITTI